MNTGLYRTHCTVARSPVPSDSPRDNVVKCVLGILKQLMRLARMLDYLRYGKGLCVYTETAADTDKLFRPLLALTASSESFRVIRGPDQVLMRESIPDAPRL